LTTQVEPEGDDPFVLHPGEFVLGSTYETWGCRTISLVGWRARLWPSHAVATVAVGGRWIRSGSGDLVFGVDGRPTPVVAATEIMSGRPCYEVCFSDGQTIIADAAHLWRTTTKSARKHGGPPRVVTTTDIAALAAGREEWNHHVELGGAGAVPRAVVAGRPLLPGRRALVDGRRPSRGVPERPSTSGWRCFRA
jgi:hypothetical protein